MFYLLMALLAPVCETVRVLRKTGSPRQWPLVLRHFLLAATILAGMWFAAWAIGVILAWPAGIGRSAAVPDVAAYPRLVGRSMALFTLTTLAVVLAVVELLRLAWRGRELRRHILLSQRRQPRVPRLVAHIARMDAPRRRQEMDATW
jgi:hypothetical protein